MFEYCSLVSGSSGNCHFIKTSSTKILIDVGLSARRIVKSLEQIGESIEDIDAVFLSHVHGDHTRGLEVLFRRHGFDLYAHESVLEALHLSPNDRVKALTGGIVDLDALRIESFELPHDAPMTLGFRMGYNDKFLSIATDLGHVSESVMEMLRPSDFLILEANHDEELVRVGPYPYHLKRRILGQEGHLSNEAAGRLISRLYKEEKRLRFVMLAHLSEKNNYPELARISVEKILEEEGIEVGRDLILDVAHRDHCTAVYRIL
ncbi:MAG: MBL fold metallo-hydrolase [Tissierellia bacterium]|nr:MBL fold metallo-hydrolase [Tissierellia bacterium]